MENIISSILDFFESSFTESDGLSSLIQNITDNLSGLLGSLFSFLSAFLDTLLDIFSSGNTLLGILFLLLLFKIIRVVKT